MIIANITVEITRYEETPYQKILVQILDQNSQITSAETVIEPDHLRSDFDRIWEHLGLRLKHKLSEQDDAER